MLDLKQYKRILCFGMPGTGKSTFVRSKPISQQIVLDLGHNAFKSEEHREKFYRKAVKHTTTELNVISKLSWYYDSYAEYFDVKEVGKHDILVIFAIPSVDDLSSIIVPRVKARDGEGEFPTLYEKNFQKWRVDFESTYNKWKSILGSHRVVKISKYDDLSA